MSDKNAAEMAEMDLARTNARASQAATDVVAAIGRVLIGEDAAVHGPLGRESYKRRILVQALEAAFVAGASWGTKLAIEHFEGEGKK